MYTTIIHQYFPMRGWKNTQRVQYGTGLLHLYYINFHRNIPFFLVQRSKITVRYIFSTMHDDNNLSHTFTLKLLQEKIGCESFKVLIACQSQIGCRSAVTNDMGGGIPQA